MRCPKCKREYPRLLALSRRDNKTMICDECGTREAMEDFLNYKEKETKEDDKGTVRK